MDDVAKARSVFLLALSLFLGGGWTSQAAVRFDVFVGYDGLIPQGSWMPLTFEVENSDDGFIGMVEISPGQFATGHDRKFRVELPKGTVKRFTVPVFVNVSWNPAWKARLYDEKRRVRAEADASNLRRFNATYLPVAAALTRQLPSLPDLKARQENMRAMVGRMQPGLVPDNPLAFDGLDVLYLTSERALELRAGQVAAVNAWLHGGGHLIVALEQPGHLAGPGAWLAQLLPGVATEIGTSRDHSALEQWVRGTGRIDGQAYDFSASASRQRGAGVNPFANLAADPDFTATPLQVARLQVRGTDGTVVVGSAEQPLVVTAQRGVGRLTVLTFSPELEPFRSWKNAPYFWAKAIELAPELLLVEWPNRGANRPMDSIFGAMIDSRQIRKLPVGWLLLLLVVYLVVIGPFDRWWLKKINRQMLTWITFPAYVAFFSLLIYFIGYKLRAGETEWSELHVVDVIPAIGPANTQEIRGRSFGSIYSPVNATYALATEVPQATFRGEFTGNYGNQDNNRGQIEQRPDGVACEMDVPVWTSQLFVSDWWKRAASPVTVDVSLTEIRVANRLDRALTSARLVEGESIFDLGEIPPGGTKTFTRTRLNRQPLLSLVTEYGNKFASVTAARQQVFSASEGGRMDDWTNAVIAASFLARWQVDRGNYHEMFSANRGFDLSPVVRTGKAVLLAWAPGHSPVPALNRFSARRTKRDTVFRVIATPVPASAQAPAGSP